MENENKIKKLLYKKADSWWYHQQLKNEGKISEYKKLVNNSVKHDFDYIQDTINNNGFVTIGRGGYSIHKDDNITLSGYTNNINDLTIQACILSGIPVLNTLTIPEDKIIQVIKFPLMSINKDDFYDEPMNYRPFKHVFSLYIKLGAEAYNL